MTENGPSAPIEPADPKLAREGQQRLEIVELGEYPAGPLPELAPGRGQLDALALAAEQLDAVALLERSDLHRDRRLADAEPERAAGEAARARDRREGAVKFIPPFYRTIRAMHLNYAGSARTIAAAIRPEF
jgi:hypothetical protein